MAHLPGILRFSLAMPDIHWGYGFPIGGVAAVDLDEGAVSPGGVGYDINCGVRLVTTALPAEELRPHLRAAAAQIYRDVPAGVGASRAIPRLGDRELERGARGRGALGRAARLRGGPGRRRAVRGGRAAGRRRSRGGERAGARAGRRPARDPRLRATTSWSWTRWTRSTTRRPPRPSGSSPGQVVIQIHSGSRGLGYQVCDETLAALTPRLRALRPGLRRPPRPPARLRARPEPRGARATSAPCRPRPTSPGPTGR